MQIYSYYSKRIWFLEIAIMMHNNMCLDKWFSVNKEKDKRKVRWSNSRTIGFSNFFPFFFSFPFLNSWSKYIHSLSRLKSLPNNMEVLIDDCSRLLRNTHSKWRLGVWLDWEFGREQENITGSNGSELISFLYFFSFLKSFLNPLIQIQL